MPKFIPYIVKQGDHLDKIAYARGCTPDEIWTAEKNADLRAQRGTGNILSPGDLIWLPVLPPNELPLQAHATNSFTAKPPTTELHLKLETNGQPLANESFVIPALDPKLTHKTDGDGAVTLKVPIHHRELLLHFVDLGMSLTVSVGLLDPVGEGSGLIQRLQNVGVLHGHGPFSEAALHDAIVAFQKRVGITPNGEMDEATRAALTSAHGC
jgi:hypothetical protein